MMTIKTTKFTLAKSYDHNTKSIEIQHFVDLGPKGNNFSYHKQGCAKISTRILYPERCREDKRGNLISYTEGRGPHPIRKDGYLFSSIYTVSGRINIVLAKNFHLEKGTKIPKPVCEQTKGYLDSLKAKQHLAGCLPELNKYIESAPSPTELSLLSAAIRINAPQYVGDLKPEQANLLQYLLTKAGLFDVKSTHRANVRPEGETHVCSVDLLGPTSNEGFKKAARVLCNLCKQQIPGFDPSSIDSIIVTMCLYLASR